MIPSFLLALLRALNLPDGPGGELMSARRKSHLLAAGWYAHLAAAGKQERRAAPGAKPSAVEQRACRLGR